MWLPRWIKRLFFAVHPDARAMLGFVTTGGLRALETRSIETPAAIVFGVFDGESVIFKTFARHDVDPDLSDELSQILADATKKFLEEHE